MRFPSGNLKSTLSRNEDACLSTMAALFGDVAGCVSRIVPGRAVSRKKKAGELILG